jgi:peptide/nickel transport system ATP-binding protein
MTPLLDVVNLRVRFETEDGVVHAVDGVSFSVEEGRTLGIVGESGSGKSVTGLTVMGLTRARNASLGGHVLFDGDDVLEMDEQRLRALRGNDVAMIFQDPLSSLHPFYTVGKQLVEAYRTHNGGSRQQGRERAAEMLNMVGVPDPRSRLDSYPHEFSGGMRQRAMIAMALINEPRVLIADEPTTALDVTVQAQILDIIQKLQAELRMAVIMITHDLGVVAELADDVSVMYAGRVVERATADTLFDAPQHPYTWGLLGSIPRLTAPRDEELVPIAGRPPSLITPPTGCNFHPRCPYVQPSHREIDPMLEPTSQPGHSVACLLPEAERKQLWAKLRQGAPPDEARAAVPEREVPS